MPQVSLIENFFEVILWSVTEMYKNILEKTLTSNLSQLRVNFDNLFNKGHNSYYSKTLTYSKFLEK